MSGNMELGTISSSISELRKHVEEIEENQDRRYIKLKNELMKALKNEVRRLTIDQTKLEMSNNSLEGAYALSIKNEGPLSLATMSSPKRQLTTKQQSHDRVQRKIDMALLQRWDVLVSQREGDRDGNTQEYIAPSSSDEIEVSLGKLNHDISYQ